MEPDDRKGAYFLKELLELTQIRRMLKCASDQSIGQHMDALAREITTLKEGAARRPDIVREINTIE
jgi:hypothetical protein